MKHTQNIIDNPLKITVLGTGTSTHQLVVATLEKYLKQAKIAYTLNQESDVSIFIEKGIQSVPSVQIDDQTLPIRSNGSFNKSLRSAISTILRKRNFGNMKKIVIPIDFSTVSTNAFMYGHRLSTDMEAVVKALHVYFPSSKELTASTKEDVDFKIMRESHLKNFVAKFNKDWSSDIMATSLIDPEFKIGFPGEEILNSIEDNAAELIIMGTTGDSGTLKKWFGSVSTKIMDEAPCPVLLIPENARYTGIQNILYAYDDIELDSLVLQPLINFCKYLDATLHLVHVDESDKEDPGFHLRELVKEKYPENKIQLAHYKSTKIVEVLEEYANVNNIDIIALGTKSRSFFDRIFHKSISKKMALNTKIPLLVLKH